MTREEIERTIENGESVWCIFLNEIYEFKTQNHSNRFIKKENDEEIYNYTDENGANRCFPIKALYKSKAKAEHYLSHANITRTETLPFLTWKEFKRKRELKFNSADGNYCELFIVNDFIYLQLGKEISMKQQNVGEATEANFYKAYDECVRLFRGGND